MGRLDVLVKFGYQFIGDGLDVAFGFVLLPAILLDLVRKGFLDQLDADAVGDFRVDIVFHQPLVFVPKGNVTMGMAALVVVGTDPGQVFYANAVFLCQGLDMPLDILLPCLMVIQPQFHGGFRSKGNDAAEDVDVFIGKLPDFSGDFLPGFKLHQLAGRKLAEQSMPHSLVFGGAGAGGDIADMGVIAFRGLSVIGVSKPLLIHQNRHRPGFLPLAR
ncbi:hypothetical protein DSOL_5042 [Desulfosporosinus metallidurans]|uniref:Uncharacterized protein n=1 Tax=Desulfosporosinus metallidurans TaxID=1888891 RepID=A0A1Q8QG70_9FIRM|nr:hypothetical protein DSOL_5042 [Desulfosporosinus metallidurans]